MYPNSTKDFNDNMRMFGQQIEETSKFLKEYIPRAIVSKQRDESKLRIKTLIFAWMNLLLEKPLMITLAEAIFLSLRMGIWLLVFTKL